MRNAFLFVAFVVLALALSSPDAGAKKLPKQPPSCSVGNLSCCCAGEDYCARSWNSFCSGKKGKSDEAKMSAEDDCFRDGYGICMRSLDTCGSARDLRCPTK